MYHFSENGFGDLISITNPYDEVGIGAGKVPVGKILRSMCDSGLMKDLKTLCYIYDYGDCWEHLLYVESLNPEESKKADLMDGGGACPPEDCGSITGFADIKKCLRTGKDSEIHGDSWVPWLESQGYRNYDPEVFDMKKARKGVRQVG